MSITAFTGPLVSFGNEAGASEAADYNPEGATSLFFHGGALLDHRGPFTYNPGQDFGATNNGWLGFNTFKTVWAPPVTLSNTIIAAAAHITAGTPMTLASATTTGLAVGVSFPRQDTNVLVTGLLELDPLAVSCTASLTSGSNVFTVSAMGTGSGNHPNGLCPGMVLTDSTTAANIPTGTYITGYTTGSGGVGTYTMSANATATAASDTVTGLFTGTLVNPITGNTSYGNTIPFGSAGTVRLYNPMAMIARAVSITSTTSQVSGTVFTINGLDIYGYPMSETITTSGTSATTTNGKKAFKYIKSVTPTVHSDGTGSYSVGTLDIIGFPLRSDVFQLGMEIDISLEMNNAAITSATGYVAAVVTSPATATTGDVRGTYTLQTSSNGTLLAGVSQSPLVANMGSTTGLFGVTQYTAW